MKSSNLLLQSFPGALLLLLCCFCTFVTGQSLPWRLTGNLALTAFLLMYGEAILLLLISLPLYIWRSISNQQKKRHA